MIKDSGIPGDLIHAAVGVKTLLKFTPEDEWASIIGKAILAERNAERQRSKETIEPLLGMLKSIKLHGEMACVVANPGGYSTGGKKPAMKEVFQFPRHMLVDFDDTISRSSTPAQDGK